MNKTADRAAIAIASLSLTACGGTDNTCEKPAAAETTVTATTATYVPERLHGHPPRPAGHSSSTKTCTDS